MSTNEVSYNLGGVVRNMSLPVAGVTMLLYDYWTTGRGLVRHFVAEQVTGPKGDFAFDVRKGVYSLEIIPNRDTRFSRQSLETIKVTHNTTFNMTLQTGCTFSGNLRTQDGETITDCKLLFYGIEPQALRAAEYVDEKGRFSITLPVGKYYVACRHSAYREEEDGEEMITFLAPTFQILEIDRDLRQDVVIPSMVQFSGAINNADGHPVAGCRAVIRSSARRENNFEEEADLKAICISDDAGRFECVVEPGHYDIKLEPPPQSHLSERLFNSILMDQTRTRTFALGPGYRLYGQVTYEGKPVQSALVSVFGGKIDSSVLTDSKGRYSFSLSGGTYRMAVTAQPDSMAKLPFRTLSPHLNSINLTEDTQQNVALEKGVVLNGKVLDNAGQPRPGILLSLHESPGFASENGHSDRAIAYGLTGDDGSYEFRVNPGTYLLMMNNQRSSALEVHASDETRSEELTWQNSCLVYFQVVSEFDEPVPNCQISCEPYGMPAETTEETICSVTSDDAGVAQINLPVGIYSFRFDPPSHGSFLSKDIRQLSINSDLNKKIRLAFKA